MASKQELLSIIKPGTKLTKEVLKRIYGYGVTDKLFPDQAIALMEQAGCTKAKADYNEWVEKYERGYNVMLKKVATEYLDQINKKDRKQVNILRKEQHQSREQRWAALSKTLGYL